MAKKVKFTFGDSELMILPISVKDEQEANKVYNKALQEAISSDYLIQDQVDKILRERGLDDDSIDEATDQLGKQLKEKEKELRLARREGRRMTKEEGKAIALEMRSIRNRLKSIGQSRGDLLSKTAESFADNERWRYLIWSTTVDAKTGERFWPIYNDFKSCTDVKLISEVQKQFLSSALTIDPNYEMQLYENSWLIRQGFMNKQLQLLNDDGKVVDDDGRLIDPESGRYINALGEFIDQYGNPIDKDGNLLVVDAWDTTEVVSNVKVDTNPQGV